jgi:hypothetical protein
VKLYAPVLLAVAVAVAVPLNVTMAPLVGGVMEPEIANVEVPGAWLLECTVAEQPQQNATSTSIPAHTNAWSKRATLTSSVADLLIDVRSILARVSNEATVAERKTKVQIRYRCAAVPSDFLETLACAGYPCISQSTVVARETG